MGGIFVKDDGTYEVTVQTQDSSEFCGVFEKLCDAINAWKESEVVINRRNRETIGMPKIYQKTAVVSFRWVEVSLNLT